MSYSQGLRAATGFADQNEDILTLLRTERHLESMPMTVFVYIPEIQGADVVHVPLGRPEAERVEYATFSLFCDQGYVPETRLTFPKSKKRSTSRNGKTRGK
jgi:hypothetical protein